MQETGGEVEQTIDGLFSINQITLAVILGTPIAGCVLLAKNYGKLHRPNAAKKAILYGIIGTIFVGVVAFLLPERFPNMIWPVAYTAAMREGVRHLHSGEIARYGDGREGGSWGMTVAIGLGFLILVAAIMVGVSLLILP